MSVFAAGREGRRDGGTEGRRDGGTEGRQRSKSMRRPLVVLLTAACSAGGAPALAQVFPRSPDSHRIETRVNTLEGKPLRYLIGTDGTASGRDDEGTVVSYSTTPPA